jgi:hypothetical protein
MSKFDVPESIQEARERMAVLIEATQLIEVQLTNYNVAGKDGNRLSVEEWNTWRNSARYALVKKRAEHRFLKDWVRSMEEGLKDQAIKISGDDGSKPVRLLLLAYKICRKHLDLANLPPAELTVLDAIRLYLREHPSKEG